MALLIGTTPALALNINATFSQSVLDSGFVSQIENGFGSAAAAYSSQISSAVSINIAVDWVNTTQYLGAASDLLHGSYAYSQVLGSLLSDPASHASAAFLPGTAPAGPSLYYVPSAEFKALTGTASSATDAFINFSSAYSWTFDPSGGVAGGTYDFLSVAEHEIAHALGRIGGVFAGTGTLYRTPMDLYRCSTATSTIALSDTSPDYLSVNGCQTVLQTLSTTGDTSDVTDLQDAQTAFTNAGSMPSLMGADLQVLQALGYSLAPEPASLAVLGTALAGLRLVRRRRVRKG